MSSVLRTARVTPWRTVLAVGAGVAMIVSLIVSAFLWPTVASQPRDVPVVVAGPSASAMQVADRLTDHAPGAFAVNVVEDRADAVRAIESRNAYGAVILDATGSPEVLTTTAGSSAVAQSLISTTAALAGATDVIDTPAVAVTDVVPLSADDVRGSGLAAAIFPLVMGGLLGGVALSLIVQGATRRLVGVLATSLASGVAITVVLHSWFAVLQGSFWGNAAAITLSLAAMSGTIVGAASLFGRAGMAVGPVVFMLFANPIASSATPVEFLPAPWGAIGQAFPPGAAAQLLRDISYFPAADTTRPWLVLAAWTALGVILAVSAIVRSPSARTLKRTDDRDVVASSSNSAVPAAS
ncbi:hypothetical protein JXX30_00305 [Rhodococcus erythropolis]|uniref:hypothetical protein n=1 Tax=Rhodococcus erythropolis TaxID=1833 RepID=UPI00197F960C|nr:hypothetical protein [Rhodococcus erythropolis]QSE41318.1 hypothetical protein JXX30_00305 [Rhodococcus erythropolis]